MAPGVSAHDGTAGSPLLEREEPLRQLGAWLNEAQAGRGRLVLLGGEAGVGKTVLIQRFCRDLPRVTRFLVGACDALSTPRPLGPLIDIAATVGGALERALAGEKRRHRVFQSFLIELTSSARPTVVVFEDVHWADGATLDLLRFVGRRCAAARALVIATYRDDEVGPKHPLRVALGDLATTPEVRRLMLAPLSEAAVRLLAQGSRVDSDMLYQQTRGNPFFVAEVLAAGAGGIPVTVRDAVLARAARLPPR